MWTRLRLRPVGEVVATLLGLTAVLAPALGDAHITVVSLLFLLATLVLAARWGLAAGIAAAVAANLLVNFFFVEPLHRLTVASSDQVASLAVFLGVAAVGAFMLGRLREQAARARSHEAETATLLRVTHEVAEAATTRAALNHLCEEAARATSARGCSLLVGSPLEITAATIDDYSNRPPGRDELSVAAAALHRGAPVVLGPDGPRPGFTFVPVFGEVAVLRLVGRSAAGIIRSPLFEGLTNELRATMRRARLDAEASRSRELARSGEFKSLLLTSVSHDLRSPLTAIKAAVSSLRDNSVAWTAADRAEFLETIESQADRLTRTVGNLLEMSRLEGTDARARLEAVEVAPLLADVAVTAAGVAQGHEVTDCAAAGLWVRGEYGLLVGALGNLVENAVKYGASGAPIRLTGTSAPGRVFLSVTNSGPPIDPSDLPHVFERAYRGKREGSRTGAGLGLALVKAIAERTGGSVSVVSDDNETTFTLSLPMANSPL